MVKDELQPPKLPFLGSVEGEITFFRSVMRARPVGIHRHFHVLTIRNAIYKDTGQLVTIDDIWDKLRTCYDLDALENIDLEADHFEIGGSNNSTPISIPSPSPSEDLDHHPFFREEFSLPHDQTIESLIVQRRMRDTPSPPSSRAPSPAPAPPPKARKRSRRGKAKVDMAGLVGGDSDSSALTQESGDERVAPTPSVVTGTDAGSEEGGEEEEEEPERSPSPSTKPVRTRTKGPKKAAAPTAGRSRTAKAAPRTTKKKKR